MKEKILIVDDEAGIVELLKSYFEMQDYLVLTACDGAKAIRQASKNPDLVLLDINMPDLDGLTVCERIRSHIACPILFLTARIETSDKIKGFQAGADDYIVKPSTSMSSVPVSRHTCGVKTGRSSTISCNFSPTWSSTTPNARYPSAE